MNNRLSLAQRRALWALSLAYFIQATGALSVAGSLSAISHEWGLSDGQSARLLAIFGLTFAISAPLAQVFLGHMMRKYQVLAGMLVFGLGAFIFAIAPDYTALVISRVVMGLGASLIGPVLVALGAELVTQHERGSAIATILLGVSMASMVGIPLAAWIANGWGARTLFALVALVSVLTALAVWFSVPNIVKGVDIRLRQVGQVLMDGKSLAAFLVVFFITSGVYDMYAFISPMIRDRWQGDTASVSVALTVIGVAGILGNLFVGRAARRYSAERLLVTGITMLVLDMLLLMILPGKLALLYLLLVLWAFSTDLLWPTQQRRIVEIASAATRGISLALTSAFMFCGIGFGSAVASWLYPLFGFYGVMLSAVLFLLLALISLWISERLRVRSQALQAASVC
ncbi:MFS transporter [Kosakonia sacchari]|uniref:MFS transporter n=2 Tax=Enterobacteriaceae TaxID=543 RepID=UPI00034F03E9|nr:MFS transporter [Kosakonia sacchari]AGN85497.1 major facilitator transporter [Enterobacter sp. R4-368]PDO83192.1 MFS transporter [Kosakonia sacchari]QHM97116.1 MFS transporter [Kosakonia sacchari]